MNREQRIALVSLASLVGVGILIAAIVLMVGGGGSGGGRSGSSVTAQEILTDFEMDKDSAEKRYVNKKWAVSGKVASAIRIGGGTWITLDGQGPKKSDYHVVGTFPIHEEEAPPAGKEIVFEGILDHVKPVGTRHSGQVFFVNCRFIR